MAYGVQNTSSAPPAPVRENTALEAHLHELSKLNDNLSHAVGRSERCADRLLGCEPQSIAKADQCKDAAEPPILRRLELALMQSQSLCEAIHRQLERMERL